ncbi:5-bromo-4-chloroindolyl phosphate hydrolysis family protein [Pseudooceanicola sp.]|uniref:5-bromo-4-chloroindolyl phosphate hydrolysis family protein n=1 Tax=Pseudooceanicola sp. TaxID=1914328 RepID=UPI00263436F5|nr:5-bromo-4-chloroindolyl phosphate hydrolysis family protein [Pseudooceanicola sp.]MDF1855269.1 5-bromo-4-chloroindolyl phosphate hydrolysis family protein [Pseudooceanicola sp.]
MAQRYGGDFSPDGENQPKPPAGNHRPRRNLARPDPAGARSNFLFVPPLILAATSIAAGAVGLAIGLVGAASWALAAWLTREGLRAEAAYHDRKVARRPALPRKILGSFAIALGTGLAATVHGASLLPAGLYAVITGALHLAAFGPDPLRDKSVEGIDNFQQDRVARVVVAAEAHLKTMQAQIDTLRDRALSARVAGFVTTAREMIRTVENDPRDLTSARKFLGVYLMGARDATVKFADVYGRNHSADARAAYEALLTDLEQNFAARTEKLMLDDRSDLTVEIDVLRERLQREGVRAPKTTE